MILGFEHLVCLCPYNISLTIEPLVRLLSIPDSLASTPDPPDEENDPDAMEIIAAVVDAAEDTHYIEDIPRLYYACTTLADRRASGTEDKAAGQCRRPLCQRTSRPSGCRCYRALLPAAASTLSTASGHHPREAAAPEEFLGASSTHAPPRGAEAVDGRRPGKTSLTWRRHGSSYLLPPPSPSGTVVCH